jgi:hypothetical protein
MQPGPAPVGQSECSPPVAEERTAHHAGTVEGLSIPFTGPTSPLSDTFGDPHVRALVERARAARGSAREGLESFEATLWERARVGLDGERFRRERGLFEEERSGLMRWSADGDRIMRWNAARWDSSVLGRSSADSGESANEYSRSLLTRGPPPPLNLDPSNDRIVFGNNFVLDPLADTAGLHYRYQSGDTLRITLPAPERTLVLAEVRVIPRRSEFRLVSASLWLEEETGALVQAHYRTARPFDVRIDGSPDYPGFLPTIEGEVRLVTVEYSLQEMEWWIPRRYAFEGEARFGGLFRLPMTIEWLLTGVLVNEDPPASLDPENLPEGWTRGGWPRTAASDSIDAEEKPASEYITLVPPGAELATGEGLRSPRAGELASISRPELRELEERLRALAPARAPGLETRWGLTEGLTRFNRVEGFATGVGASQLLPRGGRISAEVRLGHAAPIPTGEVRYDSGPTDRSVRYGAYHRLVPSSDFDAPLGLPTSLSTLLLGGGPDPFHRAVGGEAVWSRGDRRSRATLRLFGEWQTDAERGTHFHVRRLFDSDRSLAEVHPAMEGFWGGGALGLRWQSGDDPNRARLFVRSTMEAGAGETTYGRGTSFAGVTLPVSRRFGLGLEAGGGGSVGDLPPQRHFFPGGSAGYRGGRVGERMAEHFTLARAEAGTGIAAARVILFADLLHLYGGPEEAPLPVLPRSGGGELAVGSGLSFFDGLVRMEAARRVRPDGGWSVYFYFDGLF